MGFLTVGIQENLVLSNSTGFDDNGYFTLGFTTNVNTSNMFAAFDGDGALEADEATPKFFVPGVTGFEGKPKTFAKIGEELNGIKKTFIDVLATQMPLATAKQAITAAHMFAGLGITAANQNVLATKLLEEDFIKACYNNICNAFLKAATPFIGKNPFRVKLIRQSKAKHFPTVPKQGKYPNLWIESMQIPKESSKIVFSTYEIKNGLNDGTPVDSDTPSAEATAQAGAMFDIPAAPMEAPAAPEIPQSEGFTQFPEVPETPGINSNPFNVQ